MKREESYDNDPYSKEMALCVSGVAIIMMFFFHFFAYPDLYPHSDCYIPATRHLGVPIEQIVAPFGQLCVAIFAFNSGYILSKNPSKFLSYSKILSRMLKFMLGFWIVSLLFLGVGFIFGAKLPDISTFLLNLIGLKLSARADYVNVAHGWYVTYYCILLLLSPAICRIFYKTSKIFDIIFYSILVIFIPFAPTVILNLSWPIVASISGFYTHKYHIFTILNSKIGGGKFKNFIYGIVLFLIAFALRHFFSRYNAWWRIDGLYALLAIYALTSIISSLPRHVVSSLTFIGSIGMFLWFIHSCFVYPVLNDILYMPRIPVLILGWGLILCIIPAILCCILHKLILQNISLKQLFTIK